VRFVGPLHGPSHFDVFAVRRTQAILNVVQLAECDILLLFISASSTASRWTTREWTAVLHRQLSSADKTIIPVRLATTVVGRAYSAACNLALAGDIRRIDRNGTLMMHYPHPASPDAAAQARQIVCEYTGRRADEVAVWMGREQYFTAEEAVRYETGPGAARLMAR